MNVRLAVWLTVITCVIGASACATVQTPFSKPASREREMIVTATAYNSTRAQTDSTPNLTAHGVHLKPGMRIIAVSRDLEAAGLRAGTRVRIEGLPGEWQVADRLPSHRRKAIDVYMGVDVGAARKFGRRQVKVSWDGP